MLSVFDPKVTREQMYLDLGKEKMDKMQIEDDPYLCCAGARSSPHPPHPPRHDRAPHARRPQPPPRPSPPHTRMTALTLRPPRPPPPGAHAIAVMTEWDVFKKLDLQKIYDAMQKPVRPRVLKPAPQPQPPAPTQAAPLTRPSSSTAATSSTTRRRERSASRCGLSASRPSTRAPISRRGARCCLLFIASLRGAFMRPVVAQKIDSPQSSGPRAGLSSLYRICVVLFLLAALFV